MARRLALLVGNSIFDDKEHFPDLRTPVNNVQDFEKLLRQYGGFEIRGPLINANADDIRNELDELFCGVKKGDLALFYYAGHGYKTPRGSFFLAARNSRPNRIAATCIRPADIRDAARESQTSHRVMVLDCCFSGQLADGELGADEPISWDELEGESVAVLASSGKAQKSWEETGRNSLFTRFLIEGIEKGAADEDQDGVIKLAEWFDYAERNVTEERPEQTPVMYLRERKGDIVIARVPVREKPLPPELLTAVENPLPGVRSGAILELVRLAKGRDAAMALAARQWLQKLTADDSKQVSQAAGEELAKLGGAASPPKVAPVASSPKPPTIKPGASRQSDHDDNRRNVCLTILQNPTRPVKERVAAGNELAALGDPRFDPAFWHLPKEENLGFVEIPAGPFLMGSDPRKDKGAFHDEYDRTKKPHTVELPAYSLARYPVTVAQFAAFVEDKEYQPDDWDCLKGSANHPVMLVTWYDALAYCKWLDGILRQSPRTPPALKARLAHGWRVTLPSEAEWEKAARGGLQLESGKNPNPDRIYPWGDEFDSNKANTKETGIGGASPVGCFPAGASPYGILDLSGNVWEWTRSLWDKDSKSNFEYPYDPRDKRREGLAAGREFRRVLRGGSFLNSGRGARCAIRGGGIPDYGGNGSGFRVVLSLF